MLTEDCKNCLCLFFSLIFGLVSDLTLHMMMLGLLICLLTYFRLPAPNPQIVTKVLGSQPLPGGGNADVGRCFNDCRIDKKIIRGKTHLESRLIYCYNFHGIVIKVPGQIPIIVPDKQTPKVTATATASKRHMYVILSNSDGYHIYGWLYLISYFKERCY